MAAAAGSASSDTLVISPWNLKNKLISGKEVETIFEAIGIASKITIDDLKLY